MRWVAMVAFAAVVLAAAAGHADAGTWFVLTRSYGCTDVR